MSLARPYLYWSEARFISTSNGQWPSPGPLVVPVPALRANDDQYIRSRFEARVAYFSPNTSSLKSWWRSADMRLVISQDPQALATPSDVGDNDPFTLAFGQMWPEVWDTAAMGSSYMVEWRTQAQDVVHQTERSFVDAGHLPQILASVFWFDESGFLGLIAEPTASIRAQVIGRSLWASSVHP